jgi:hypothetical protein
MSNNDELFIAWFPIENPTEIKYINIFTPMQENIKTNIEQIIDNYFGKIIFNNNNDAILKTLLGDTFSLDNLKNRNKNLKKRENPIKNYVIIIGKKNGENNIEKYMYSTTRFCWGKGYCSSDRLSVFENAVKKIDTNIYPIPYNTPQDNSSNNSSDDNNNNLTNITIGGNKKNYNHKLTKKINTKNYKKSKKNRH